METLPLDEEVCILSISPRAYVEFCMLYCIQHIVFYFISAVNILCDQLKQKFCGKGVQSLDRIRLMSDPNEDRRQRKYRRRTDGCTMTLLLHLRRLIAAYSDLQDRQVSHSLINGAPKPQKTNH